jgi:hypothetical protein
MREFTKKSELPLIVLALTNNEKLKSTIKILLFINSFFICCFINDYFLKLIEYKWTKDTL